MDESSTWCNKDHWLSLTQKVKRFDYDSSLENKDNCLKNKEHFLQKSQVKFVRYVAYVKIRYRSSLLWSAAKKKRECFSCVNIRSIPVTQTRPLREDAAGSVRPGPGRPHTGPRRWSAWLWSPPRRMWLLTRCSDETIDCGVTLRWYASKF